VSARRAALVAVLLVAGCGAANRPPDIAPIGAIEVTVGDTLVVPLHAVDPDGGRVRFSVRGAPEGAAVENGADGSRFVFSPLASDAKPGGSRYDLVFTARDPDGAGADAPAVLTVWHEGSVPAFDGPFAWTLNLAATDRLSVRVRVRDYDTARLDLRLLRGIDGAVFEVVDGHTASLFWKPRPSQIAAGPVFTFQVGASDREHPEVLADFAVVLVNPDLFGGCPGTAPVGRHEPVGDVRGGGSVALALTATDAESRVRAATLYWSAAQAADGAFNEVPATGEDGAFEAAIPDLSAAAADGLLVFYHFEASDDDDPKSAACDHQVRVPKTGEFAFAVYADPDAGCLDDDLCRHCTEANAPPLPDETVAGLRLCGDEDVFQATVPQGGVVGVVARPMSSTKPPRIEVRNPEVEASGNGRVLATVPAGGVVHVAVIPPDGDEMTYELSAAVFPSGCDIGDPEGIPIGPGRTEGEVCPTEIDTYLLELRPGEAARLTLTFDPALADLDLRADDAFGNVVESAGSVGPEQVTVEYAGGFAHVVTVSAVGLGSAPYALDVAVSDLSDLCTEDLLAPNATPGEAAVVPEGTWDRLKLCPGTTDHVRVGLNGGETLLATVAAEGDVPLLAILDPDGGAIATGATAEGARTAEVEVPGPGDYVIRIGPAAGDEAVPYALSFGATDPAGECRPDRLEPNDSPDESLALANGYTTHLTLCDGDRDVFSFRLAEWESFSAWLLAGSAFPRGILLGPDKVEVALGQPTSFGEEVFHLAKENGTYWLVVEPDGESGWYDVGIERL